MTHRVVVAFALLFLAACGGKGETVSLPEDSTDQATLQDAAAEVDAQGRAEEVRGEAETAEPELIFDTGPDLPFVECQPGEGCFLDPCDANDQCQSGWCVEHLGDGVCSQNCQEECPSGWVCQQAGTGPDLAYICVSRVANLCRPCATGADCKSPGGSEDVCVDYGEEGSFCGGACLSDEECPFGFSCVEAVSVAGVTSKQCVADAGVCPCAAKSAKLGLTTPCEVANEFGSCEGLRVCTDAGLSPCDAAAPSGEVCNGKDDDCDGDVDEPDEVGGNYVNLCDDGNGCTTDICLGEAGCEHEALTSGECVDGNPCTVADHCEAGVCVGDPVQCDDENPCTDNVCTANGGCEYPAVAGECDDGDVCTLGDHCSAGECVGEAVACECDTTADCAVLEDGNKCNGTLVCATEKIPHLCVVDPATVKSCPEPEGVDAPCLAAACDPATGSCSVVAAHEGFPCSDGDPCTVGDLCAGGECQPGAPANCNDGNPCTTDWCTPAEGCAHGNSDGKCTDDDACTVGDQCADGVCQPGAPLPCNDGNPCTTDSCDADVGCFFEAKSGSCSDGDACTLGDQCVNGVCQPGGAADCDDGNPCTADSCDPAAGCVHTAAAGACSDGNACTVGDHCEGGKCLFTGALVCDDENICTTDSCDPAVGCAYKLNKLPCDDGDPCTLGDVCQLGECVGGPLLACDDGNPCTDDACKPGVGCEFKPNQDGCDDGNACTLGDHCSGGSCKPASMLSCDDGNQCTDDACDSVEGCVNTNNSKPCIDGDVCTTGDHCEGGECVGGEALDCDDDNPCTDDSCDPLEACVNTPNSAACSDANQCTTGDHCDGGLCVTTGLLLCDDGNVCTNDNCDPDLGCIYSANSQPCSDGNACTVDDQCGDGACQSGEALVCPDDGNTCTSEGCDPQSGCKTETVPDCCGNGIKEGAEQCDDGNQVSDDGCSATCEYETSILVPGDTEKVAENFGMKVRCTAWEGDICTNAQVMVPGETCPAYQWKDLWHISVYGNDSEQRNCPNWCALATAGNTSWEVCQSGSGQVPGNYRSCAYSTSTHCQADDFTWKTDYPAQNGNLHIRLGSCYPDYPKIRIRCAGW